MINFFRRIRKKLADDNKPLKYMRYAIGEIVLVVIGILIALSVNNWNTNINNLDIEKQLLQGIKSDLINDTLEINNSFYWAYNRRVRYFKQYDSLIKIYDSKPNIRFVDSIFGLCLKDMNTFFPSSGTYKEIISSGRSNIFTNDSLFKKIQRLYDIGYEKLISEGQFIDELTYDIQLNFSSRMYYQENWRRGFYINPETRGKTHQYFNKIRKFESNINFWRKQIIDLIGDIEHGLLSD